MKQFIKAIISTLYISWNVRETEKQSAAFNYFGKRALYLVMLRPMWSYFTIIGRLVL